MPLAATEHQASHAEAGVSPTPAAASNPVPPPSPFDSLKDQGFPLSTFGHHPGFAPEAADQPGFSDTVPSSPTQFFPQAGSQSRSVSPFTLAQPAGGSGGGARRKAVVVLSEQEHPEFLLPGSSESSPPPPVKVFADQESLNKYLRRRAKNNEAATKSRKKKRELEEANFQRAKELAEENSKLKEELQALRAETKALKDMFSLMWQSKK